VKLTSDGWIQAEDAGRRLKAMLRNDDTIRIFTSPYRRTRETTEGILRTLTAGDDAVPSPFKRNDIKVYEEPRLREQDFGNFQPCQFSS
jgi:broad specificity phosphatase PhoE